MIKRIDHINIVVSNLEEARDFFLHFGFSATEPAELKGEWISSVVRLTDVSARYVVLSHSSSSITIELLHYSHPPSGRDAGLSKANQIGFRHLAFEVEDIEAAVGQLRDKGVKFLSDIQIYEKAGKKLVYFYGPDGILLEFAEYGR